MNIRLRSAVCLAALAWTPSLAPAAQPFVATAQSTDAGPPVTLTAQGASFFDFLSSLVQKEGQFQALNNRAFTGNMTFLGLPSAILYRTNGVGNEITITLAPIGFNRTFRGTTKDDVDNQLEDFFEKDGAKTIADFLKAVAKGSPIAVTDGNPTSATALAASASFTGQGFTPADELNDGAEGSAKPKLGGLSFGLNSGVFEAGAFEGKTYDFSGTILSFGGDTVRLVLPFNLNYLELDGGSQVGGAGISAVLPIRFKKMGKETRLNWRVTPLAGVSVRGSMDLASVSPLWNAGVINTLDYRLSPKLVLSVVNQFTVHKSIAVGYDDLDFDPQVDQQILKNGVRLTTPASRRVTLDAFVVDTRFLKDAAVDQFWTVGTSAAFRLTQRWNLVLGLNYDNGDNFKAYAGGISSAWKW